MKSLLESLVEQKYERMLDWRKTTERTVYPIKLSKNLLYEGLTLLEIWNELKKSFRTFNLLGNKNIYDNFTEAHKHIFVRRRQIQTDNILPIIDNKYYKISNLPYLKFDSFRSRSTNACNGNSSELEEIEFTYFFHTAAYELVYAWSAAGLLGQSKEEAFLSVCSAKWEGLDYDSLDTLVEAFGRTVSIFYKPLPNI